MSYSTKKSLAYACRSRQVHREVEAMEFVRQRTSIPSVFEIYVNENDASPSSWFSMSAISGSPLTDAWPSMNDEARRATQADLRSYLHELRTVPSPTPAYIGSCSGGSAYDHRLNRVIERPWPRTRLFAPR
ncbi:hypothetical protein VC83_03090 [Pseudogymnoascus destructans]|uniref:Aminoglycoside phosphotransferase domain-containing protein n=1 Tax=Pseudogymnoascus destructans TaxID=655981 RepID=A0A177AGE4_9PEZI|nr:uncharacterized protein VC83_03090 [Pseudogymnoascus destructans]OAF60224.1 hypothetical protein VC83_03090 [Pseudogymnoascus destructans]